MKRGVKIAIGLATIGVVGVVGYFVYKKIKDARDAKDGSENNNGNEPPSQVVGGNENSNDKTPFKNKAQGDIFRQFINRFYPSYAKEIDLDVSGDADNSFMRKAFGKYGEAYKKYNPSFAKASGTSIPKNLLDAFALRKDKGSFGNNSQGAIYLQTSSLGKIDNQNVVAYFYSNGKVSFTKGGKRVRFDKWWDKAKFIYSNKNFEGTDFYNTAYKVFVALKEGNATMDIVQGSFRTFPFDGNLQGDLDSPTRKGIGIDTNIID